MTPIKQSRTVPVRARTTRETQVCTRGLQPPVTMNSGPGQPEPESRSHEEQVRPSSRRDVGVRRHDASTPPALMGASIRRTGQIGANPEATHHALCERTQSW